MAAGSLQKKKAVKPGGAAGGGAWAALLKPIMVIVVLGGIAFVGHKVIKGLQHDPAKEQRETVARLKVGMTVDQIVAAAGQPTNVYRLQTNTVMTDPGDGTKVPIPVTEQVRIDYRKPFLQAYPAKDLEEGFWFVYSFFAGGKYVVSFDANGICTDVMDSSGLIGLPN